MRRHVVGIALAALVLAGRAAAQEQTERFIPIGESPGISGAYSIIGTVRAVDADDETVTVEGVTETWTVRVTDETDIWIDRSAARQTSLVGSWGDLAVGRQVELKCVDYATKEEADWVKIADG